MTSQTGAAALSVLYIDDDATNQAVMREMLKLSDIDMAEAPDAQTGLAMLDDRPFSVLLMDLRMPKVNGLTAIRQIRSRSDSRGRVPIAVVSADLSPGVQLMCRDAGANGFVAKPIDMDQLLDTMGTMLVESGGGLLA